MVCTSQRWRWLGQLGKLRDPIYHRADGDREFDELQLCNKPGVLGGRVELAGALAANLQVNMHRGGITPAPSSDVLGGARFRLLFHGLIGDLEGFVQYVKALF